MNRQKPRNCYEVAPGLWIGSAIGDIDRETKRLMTQWVEQGDRASLSQILVLQERRVKLLASRTESKR